MKGKTYDNLTRLRGIPSDTCTSPTGNLAWVGEQPDTLLITIYAKEKLHQS